MIFGSMVSAASDPPIRVELSWADHANAYVLRLVDGNYGDLTIHLREESVKELKTLLNDFVDL